jgi:hypothetical protein
MSAHRQYRRAARVDRRRCHRLSSAVARVPAIGTARVCHWGATPRATMQRRTALRPDPALPRRSARVVTGADSPRPCTETAAREPPAAPRPSRFAVACGEPCPSRRTSGRDEPARPRRSRQPQGVGWHPKIGRAVGVPVTVSAHGHERAPAVNSTERASRRSGHLGSVIAGLPN